MVTRKLNLKDILQETATTLNSHSV